MPVTLQEWLVNIWRRLVSTKTPTSSEENEEVEEDKKEE
jgi:hypothetical protein